MIQTILGIIPIMIIKIIMIMVIVSVEQRKQMIMGIPIIMTKTVMRAPVLQEEILLNARMRKMKNNVNRRMKILQKLIKALHLTLILQEATMMKERIALVTKAMAEKTQIVMKKMTILIIAITSK